MGGGNTAPSSKPKSQLDLKEVRHEEDIEDEGELMAKSMSSFEISQKIKQDSVMPVVPKAEDMKQQEMILPISPLSNITSPPQPVVKVYERLHAEELKKFSPRTGSPMSRQQVIERAEMKECLFKPTLGKLSQALADRHKNRSPIKCVGEALLEDAKKRKVSRGQIEQSVPSSFTNNIGSSRIQKGRRKA